MHIYIHYTHLIIYSHTYYTGDQAAGVGKRVPEQNPGHTGRGAEAVPQVR